MKCVLEINKKITLNFRHIQTKSKTSSKKIYDLKIKLKN